MSLLDHGVEKFLEMEKGITAMPNPLLRVFFQEKVWKSGDSITAMLDLPEGRVDFHSNLWNQN